MSESTSSNRSNLRSRWGKPRGASSIQSVGPSQRIGLVEDLSKVQERLSVTPTPPPATRDASARNGHATEVVPVTESQAPATTENAQKEPAPAVETRRPARKDDFSAYEKAHKPQTWEPSREAKVSQSRKTPSHKAKQTLLARLLNALKGLVQGKQTKKSTAANTRTRTAKPSGKPQARKHHAKADSATQDERGPRPPRKRGKRGGRRRGGNNRGSNASRERRPEASASGE